MIQFSKLPFHIENVYITSDLHGFHKNITLGETVWNEEHRNGCRNFSTAQEMTETIVGNINKVVKKGDLLIHCGDWSFGGKDNIIRLREMINCKNIINIQGNHDHKIKGNEYYYIGHCWMEYNQIGYYSVDRRKFVVSHYPMSIWHQSHHDVPLFYGHVHGSYENVGKSFDVGIDNAYKIYGEYRPFSFMDAYNIAMSKATFLESHHDLNTN